MANSKVVICAMGDVVSQQEDYKRHWDPALPIIGKADIRYAQAEQILSDKDLKPDLDYGLFGWKVKSQYAAAYKYAGIDVASVVGNHALEFGFDGLLDTIANLQKQGVQTCGAGKDILEAREPVILERNGTKIAFLSYGSCIPPFWAATEATPGIAPMRIFTSYQQVEIYQPGTPPDIHTYPYPEDLDAMLNDIKKTKQKVDLVAVAFHWGIHYVRGLMAQYQFTVAHAAIDAGADMIFGTHPHILKAIEVYKRKPIFYSLGNFVCGGNLDEPDREHKLEQQKEQIRRKANIRYATHGSPAINKWFPFQKKPEYSFLGPRHPDILKTGIALVEVSKKGIDKVAFRPMMCSYDRELRPIPVHFGSKEFDEVINYQMDITKEAGLDTQFEIEGDQLVVSI